MTQAPKTLGEKLAVKPVAAPKQQRKRVNTSSSKPASKQPSRFRARIRDMFLAGLAMTLLTITAAIPLWWWVTGAIWSEVSILIAMSVPLILWILVVRARNATSPVSNTRNWPVAEPTSNRSSGLFSKTKSPQMAKQHSLLANDRQGFMAAMRLDAKTAIFDGSNVYHFGNDHGLDAQPLGMLAHRLRDEGYRIVCFFDANIYHRLHEHGAFSKGTRHSVEILNDVFGLAANEVYVVPSGVQADRYILNALKHLPISFAVTNDQFRDYAKQYPDVMKGQWRKGVVISNGELRLKQHKLQTPIKIG